MAVTMCGLSHAQSQLMLNSGSFIATTGASTITLQNAKLLNNGTFTDNSGTLQFTGNETTENTSISGTGTTSVNNLTINKNTNSVQLNKNISLAGVLDFTSGGLELNSGNVDLGTTGVLANETTENTLFGTGGSLSSSYEINAPNAKLLDRFL